MQTANKGNSGAAIAKNTAIKAEETPLPQEVDLLPLLKASPRLRADLLFYTRLAGTYCQTIFWQAFAPAAKKRRKTLFTLAEETITGNEFKEAVLNPKKRNKQSSDMLHSGFVKLLEALQKQPKPQPAPGQGQIESIAEIFSRGLQQRHGLPWNMEDFIKAAAILTKQRGFLEHFEERLEKSAKGKQAEIPAPRDNAQLMRVFGLLLLPQFCNELENTLRHVKNAEGRKIGAEAAEAAAALFSHYKTERKQGIKQMFAESRARKNMFAKGQERTNGGKYKNKKQISRALLNGKWRKYYCGLKLAQTDFRENTFKRYYDFIGRQNFFRIYRLLGAELDSNKLKKIDSKNPQQTEYCLYASEGKRPSFRNEIVPLYICATRLQAQILFCLSYAPRDKKDKITDPLLLGIRNHLAHNGLLWQIPDPKQQGEPLPVKQVFAAVTQMLKAQSGALANTPKYTEFCDAVFAILEAENCPLWHSKAAADAPPQTRKIHRQTLRQKHALQQRVKTETEKEPRILLRRILRQWQKALRQAQISLAR